MKLQQLQYFVTTCNVGNMSRAAEQLHVSQPSISSAIKELEREFGVQLISRRYQGLSLTEEGKMLKELSESLLLHAEHVSNSMTTIGKQSRSVKLGIPPMICTTMLAQIYHRLNDYCPEIMLSTHEVGSKTLFSEIREGTFDLAFVSHDAPLPHEYESIFIKNMEIVWCTLADHPLSQQEFVTFEQLQYEPLAFFQEDFSVYDAVIKHFETAGISPDIMHSSGQLSTILGLIRDGICTGFLLKESAVDFPELICVPLDPPVVLQISLIWRRGFPMYKEMKKFINQVRKMVDEADER